MMLPLVNKDEASGVVYRRWVCAEPEAVFLLVHGLGAHSGRWERLAAHFLQNSISSYAIDLQGFGQAPGLKGHIDSFDLYFKDILALREIIRREAGDKPVFLVGESMGGLISFLLARRHPDAFTGLVCLSPVFRSRLKFGGKRFLRIVSSFIVSAKKPVHVPFDASMCTRDSARVKEIEDDPLEHRFATPWLLFKIVWAALVARVRPGKMKIPVLFLIAGERDAFVDPAATKQAYAFLEARDKEFKQYPEMFHALSVELGREKVFEDLSQWTRLRMRGGEA